MLLLGRAGMSRCFRRGLRARRYRANPSPPVSFTCIGMSKPRPSGWNDEDSPLAAILLEHTAAPATAAMAAMALVLTIAELAHCLPSPSHALG